MADEMDLSILVQAHLPAFDPQGCSTIHEKTLALEAAILSLRRNYPGVPIVLTGHGINFPHSVDHLVDDILWDPLAKLDRNGLVVDQPAQFKYVVQGLNLIATKYQSRYVLKCRGDGFLLNPFALTEVIHDQRYILSATQQTRKTRPYLGDLFICAPLGTMIRLWSSQDGVLDYSCGNSNLGLNALTALNISYSSWNEDFIKRNFRFANISQTLHVDLRRAWTLIPRFSTLTPDEILDYVVSLPTRELQKYLFGHDQGWHQFDLESGNIISDDSPGEYYYADA